MSFDLKKSLNDYFGKWKQVLVESAIFALFFIFLELFFFFSQEFALSTRLFYHLTFTIPLAVFFASLFSFFPRLVNSILSALALLASAVWMLTQIIYYSVFKVYMEFSKITMAGDIADNFGNETKAAIIEGLPVIIFILIIWAAFALSVFLLLKPDRCSPVLCTAGLVIALVLNSLCVATLGFDKKAQSIYNEQPRITDNNVELFGFHTSLRLELKDLIFGVKKSDTDSGFVIVTTDEGYVNPLIPDWTEEETEAQSTKSPDEETKTPGDGTGSSTDPSSEETTSPTVPAETKKTKNIIDVDLDKAIASESDQAVNNINAYVKSQTGSYVNKYTGYFKDYNLIMICAEAFSDHLISEQLTPTLYKMYNNGFVFKNYYGSMKSITTNGEYAFLTGLMPQTVATNGVQELKENSTFNATINNLMPFSMARYFNGIGGMTAAYHGHSGSYYRRDETHANLGFQLLRFTDAGYLNGVKDKNLALEFSLGKVFPSSDYELAQQTLDDYLSKKDENGNILPFYAYYMTYSGHHPYYDVYDPSIKYSKNPQSWTQRPKVKSDDPDNVINNLPYSETLKTYISCNMQVEMMLTEIESRLREAGVLEKTVIVLTNDHYPYGLSDADFRSLAGITYPDVFENAFICYNAGMTEPVIVDTVCCTVDIMPTLLNLFGFDYDSRLFAGTDILDNRSFHVAMLFNKDFYTDKIKYTYKTGAVTYRNKNNSSTVSKEYITAAADYVTNKFEISLKIVDTDYYKHFVDYLKNQGIKVKGLDY